MDIIICAGSISRYFEGKFFREFGGGNIRRCNNRRIEKFVQKFRRITRGSRYERRLLVEEFKWEMNGVIKRKLIEAE